MTRCIIKLRMVLKRASVHGLLRLLFHGAYTVSEKRIHFKWIDFLSAPSPISHVYHLSESVYLPIPTTFLTVDTVYSSLEEIEEAPELLYCNPQMFLSLPVSPP